VDKKLWNEEKGKWNNTLIPLSQPFHQREGQGFISPFRQLLEELNKIE
jgi:hypothetical protein